MVNLFCMIVGVAGCAFSVRVDESNSVDDLKDAIKAEKPNDPTLKNVPARNLQLFLAKTAAGAWLKSKDLLRMRKGEIANEVESRYMNEELEDPTDKISMKFPSEVPDGSIHVLVVVPRCVPASNNKRKRMEDDDVPDAWIKAISSEKITAIPSSCDDLKKHLQRELRVKVPIDETLFQMVSTSNLSGENTSIFNKLFGAEPRGKLSHRTATIVGAVIEPLLPCFENATEATFHYFWDSLIVGILMRVSTGSFRRHRTTSTGPYRPNLCFYFDTSVFRGEEKASGDLNVPLKELHEKLTWKYDNAPYIFGYAAVGLLVSLVAIQKDDLTDCGAKVEIIETYNLSKLNGRLSFFLALVNLSTLFRPIVDLIQPLGRPEYTTIKRSNGVTIEYAEECVVKTYPQSMPSYTIIRNLQEIHRQMKRHSVPNVVKLQRGSIKERYVMLTPIGLFSPPENIQQLLIALRDILMALVALHAINLMHRDLRWDNVLKYSDDGDKWFIIDFDDGASSPAAKVTHLKAESHAPEILSSSSHTVKVDIWSVGYLLKTSPFQGLTPELKRIKRQCLQRNPLGRPTAKSLLLTIESLIKS